MIPTALALPVLAGLLAGAALLAWQGAPWSLAAGTALAAGAPLTFMLWNLRSPGRLENHPLGISILSGLGCVAAMIATQRFGDRHEWALYAALAGLIVWMLWQRAQRSRPQSPRS